MRGATRGRFDCVRQHSISTHAPRAGRDPHRCVPYDGADISTHAPRAGRDCWFVMSDSGTSIFQPTRPVRGATYHAPGGKGKWSVFQPTRPVRGATSASQWPLSPPLISTHAPRAGRDRFPFHCHRLNRISTHAPRAGRDVKVQRETIQSDDFNPRAPCGARRARERHGRGGCRISTHAPRAGRDAFVELDVIREGISTHAPRAGRDADDHWFEASKAIFQPTRPVRGATAPSAPSLPLYTVFQPTRPVRGATRPESRVMP